MLEENQNKSDSFIKKLKKAIDLKVVAILLLVLSQVGTWAYEVFREGAELQFQKKIEAVIEKSKTFENKVDTMFYEHMIDPKVLGMIIRSPEITSFANENADRVEKTIVDRIIKEDSAKISTISFLGKEVGLRDEAILPLLAEILKEWSKGNLLTREQAEAILTRRIRGSF